MVERYSASNVAVMEGASAEEAAPVVSLAAAEVLAAAPPDAVTVGASEGALETVVGFVVVVVDGALGVA
jgi:hypothetical protein